MNVYHTNPYDADGFSDYDEAMNLFNTTTNNFNPLLADTRSKSATKTENYTGGTISVPVKIKNKGNVSYVLNNIMLEAYKITYDGNNGQNSTAAVNLYPTTSNAAEPTLLNATISAGGETGEIKFSSGELPVAAIEGILNGLIGLRVEVSAIKISSEDTKDFTKITTAVNAKTALLTVDYGPCFDSTKMVIAKSLPETKSFQVATKRVPVSENSTAPTSFKDLSLTEALADCLPNVVTYIEDDKGHKMIKSVNGVEGKFTNPEGMEGDWFIAVVTYENSIAQVKYYSPSSEEYYYNTDEIIVHAEDNITVMYSVDKDGDGLKDNEDPYPTISSALSNARLAEMNISYKPFNSASYDTGKNINLDFGIIDSKVLKDLECETLKLTTFDTSATNSDGSKHVWYVMRFDAPLEVPSNPRASLTTTDGDTATVALSWAKTTDTRATNVLAVRYRTEPQSFVPTTT